jgi:hypothetical protein
VAVKLRIVKRKKKYIPQYRLFFIWVDFTSGYADTTVEKDTIEGAEDWISTYQKENDNPNRDKVVRTF